MERIFGLKILVAAIAAALLASCGGNNHDALRSQLEDYIKDKDARIGVAVIIDDKDTVAVDGSGRYSMFSVYKFPIALALADRYAKSGKSFADSVLVTAVDLHTDTYSPMLKEFGRPDSLKVSMRRLLEYSLQQSDNNASDIIFREAGGAAAVDSFIKTIQPEGIDIKWSEDEMHKNLACCSDNSSTPVAMSSLFNYVRNLAPAPLTDEIKQIMETCSTGTDRLPAPLGEECVIGHKTGTGDVTADGRIMALNDAGYVQLPSGQHYSITVFVNDSGLGMEETAKCISDISGIVYRYLQK